MTHNHITPNYPWYNPSRISAWRTSGEGEAIARALVKNRPLLVAQFREVSLEEFIPSQQLEQDVDLPQEDDVIDTFLKCDNFKIVAQVGGEDTDVTIEVELEDIDDLVTEELAEIYLSQGLIVEAKRIYTKLSLLNSEKSVYFAELIEKIGELEVEIKNKK
ncbi:MAG: hypothetical protein SNH35_02470 [Rikenellaceae bacterium]